VAAPLFGGSVHSGSSRVSGLAVFLGLPVGRRRRAWIFFSFAVRRLGLGFLALALTLDFWCAAGSPWMPSFRLSSKVRSLGHPSGLVKRGAALERGDRLHFQMVPVPVFSLRI